MAKRDRDDTPTSAKKRSKKRSKSEGASGGGEPILVAAPSLAKENENAVGKKVGKPVNGTRKNNSKSPAKSRKSKVAFLKKKMEFTVSLLPGALRNCEEAVERSIGQLLLKYSPGIGGILMAYENITFKKQEKDLGRGWILNELPYIHFNVACDALVFRPAVGCELQGVVSECFPSHLGILVFNYFNAMVSADQLHSAGYIFDRDLQNWVTEDKSQTISTSEKIHFVVEKIHECDGTVSLEGTKPSLSLLVEDDG